MRSLLVASQKGGVGKTTTAVNLATLAGASGGGVLLLDADPLGSVAACLQLSRENDGAEVTARPDPVTGAGVLWTDALPGVDVISPYPEGDTAERHLQAFLDGLAKSRFARTHRLMVIDAPPMLGPRPKALLRAAQEVLLVQRAEPMSIRTLPMYLDLIQQVMAEGATCRLRGVLLTLAEGVTPGSPTEARLRAKFPGLLPEVIPFDAQVARALVLGCPLVVSSPESSAAQEYASLAQSLGLIDEPVLAAVGIETHGIMVESGPTIATPQPERTISKPSRQPVDDPLPRESFPVVSKAMAEPSETVSTWFIVLTTFVAISAFGFGYWLLQPR